MTRQSRYPLATDSWTDRERAALHQVVESGHYTMGVRVAELERRFAAVLDGSRCVMVSSGSAANLLMVAALFYRRERPLRRGDEVIVPAVSWPTTYYPLAQYGLRLRFVDIDLETLDYDLDALEAAITDRTRLLMVVNLLGNPNDFDRLKALCEPRGIEMIEDNCESLGATYGGRPAGTFGTMGSFSFFFSHHLSTMEGGMVATSDDELHHILLCLRAHGWTRDLPAVNHVSGTKSADPFEESFRFVLPGYNVRPLEMEAAVGLVQIGRLPEFVAARRRNAERFQRALAPMSEVFLTQREIGASSWFGFSLVLRPGCGRDRRDLVRTLTDAGIECRPIVAGNFAKNPVLRFFDHEVHGDLRNAEWIDRHGLFVGNQERDLEAEIDHLSETLHSFVGTRPMLTTPKFAAT